jgi:hypothetical protein
VTLATHSPGINTRVVVRAREDALIEALRQSPEGLRVPALAVSTGASVAAVSDRLCRLMLRGEVERVCWLWRLPRGTMTSPTRAASSGTGARRSGQVGAADRQLRAA